MRFERNGLAGFNRLAGLKPLLGRLPLILQLKPEAIEALVLAELPLALASGLQQSIQRL
jgi:hypothetical protein